MTADNLWYTNPYALGFRGEVSPRASVTLHPTWGNYPGFDAYHPCSLRVSPACAPNFQVEQFALDGRPQLLGLCGHGPCPAADLVDLPSDTGLYETCAFGCPIDLRIRNTSAESLLFVAVLTGPTRVAQRVVDEVAAENWSALSTQQCRAVLRYGGHLGGGFPRKAERRVAVDDSLAALGLICPFARGGYLPTARGLALAEWLSRRSMA